MAPTARTLVAFALPLTAPVTRCPAATNWRVTSRASAPVAPVIKTLVGALVVICVSVMVSLA
jgi:hypothetical protein